MAKKKSRLAELGLDKKTLDKIYVQAKIAATPYDYSLKDRIILENDSSDYSKITNVLNQSNDTEWEIADRLGLMQSAADRLRDAVYPIGPDGISYAFPKLDYENDSSFHVMLCTLMSRSYGFMYKHNNMVISRQTYTKFAEAFGAKAAEALIGLYVRLYASDAITPQLMLTLLQSTQGLSLDDVANLTFVKNAMKIKQAYVPDVYASALAGQSLIQMYILKDSDLIDKLSTLPTEREHLLNVFAEISRQNAIESAMYMCEICRAFNSMDASMREALAPALAFLSHKDFLDISYDANEMKFTSPEFDAFCDAPANVRFDKIQEYVRAQLKANMPEVYTWDPTTGDMLKHLKLFDDPIFRICSDLHCKAWEDFRVKNFALMLQTCEEEGIDLDDLRASEKGGAFNGDGDEGASSSDDQDFGNMHMGTKYDPADKAEAGKPGEKSQKKATPQLETMSNLIESCDTQYTLSVEIVPNSKGYKDTYLKLLKPIEFITKELTKQIRAIKTYNSGGKNPGKSRGKLDSHTMCRYKTDPNIFYDTTYKVKEMDLAFGIILDQSGSMHGDGIHNGMISLIMLHHVLASLRINHAIIGHDSHGSNDVRIKKYVAFNEDAAHTMEVPYMLANLKTGGGNCDSGALNYMEQYIKRTRNKDKIVLIFSDGEPTECKESDLHKQVRKMEREGIHVIGLGIDFENVKHYYPDHANGRTLAEMTNILVGILKRYVLEKKS